MTPWQRSSLQAGAPASSMVPGPRPATSTTPTGARPPRGTARRLVAEQPKQGGGVHRGGVHADDGPLSPRRVEPDDPLDVVIVFHHAEHGGGPFRPDRGILVGRKCCHSCHELERRLQFGRDLSTGRPCDGLHLAAPAHLLLARHCTRHDERCAERGHTRGQWHPGRQERRPVPLPRERDQGRADTRKATALGIATPVTAPKRRSLRTPVA